ncbi:MAG: ATP-binding protein [Roseburia sp.]|nr:ATP-binding protein [Roseburia sp.]
MEEFYCKDTMEYRTSDKYNSPIEDIFDSCRNPEEHSAYLLLGHRGCGKSTELNKMSEELAADGYYVKTINCSMDLFNIVYSDLFILMGEALLEIAEGLDCDIDNKLLERIEIFWAEATETITSQETDAVSLESGISVETKGIFAGILNVFAKIKTDLK